MVEKKIVDDYYSSIKSGSSDKKINGNNSKPKIKAKKIVKKVVKKVEDKPNSSTISDSKKSENKPYIKSENKSRDNSRSSFNKNNNSNSSNGFQRRDKTKKPFVQKIGVVKTEERKSSVVGHEPEKKSR